MAWELNADRPIYAQLVDTLRLRILTGYYEAGGKLPPVRELAAEAAVNPNTMQRALAELETDGLVYTQRTSGRFVTDDRQMLEELRQQLARRQLEKLLADMKELGYSPGETARLLEQMIGERQE